jgi:hypothetical protein
LRHEKTQPADQTNKFPIGTRKVVSAKLEPDGWCQRAAVGATDRRPRKEALLAYAQNGTEFGYDELRDGALPVHPLSELLSRNAKQAGAKLRAESRRLNDLLEHRIVLEV